MYSKTKLKREHTHTRTHARTHARAHNLFFFVRSPLEISLRSKYIVFVVDLKPSGRLEVLTQRRHPWRRNSSKSLCSPKPTEPILHLSTLLHETVSKRPADHLRSNHVHTIIFYFFMSGSEIYMLSLFEGRTCVRRGRIVGVVAASIQTKRESFGHVIFASYYWLISRSHITSCL